MAAPKVTPKVDDVTKIAKDALYVGVGLGVIGFQKVQVRRNELQKQLKGQLGDAKSQVGSLSKAIDDRVKLVEERLQGVEGRVEALLDQIEHRLPDPAKGVSQQARSQVRTMVNRAS